MKLAKEFYARKDTLQVSRDLLGKFLCTRLGPGRVLTAGMIVETEAYCGREDRGCHAFQGRRTRRTETMFGPAGRAYIYLCYGIHSLFNVVTHEEEEPHAVLIRALEPVDGLDEMLKRRGMSTLDFGLTSGPGRLAVALGINLHWNGTDLCGNRIWIEDRGVRLSPGQIKRGARVGMNFPGRYQRIPWRFVVHKNPWLSPPKI